MEQKQVIIEAYFLPVFEISQDAVEHILGQMEQNPGYHRP